MKLIAKSSSVILIAIFFWMLAGCSAQKITGDEKTAADFVKSLNYKISSYQGEQEKYTLEKSKLTSGAANMPYRQIWGLQTEDPEKFFGKEIKIFAFVVSNHPLEKLYDVNTVVYIMLSEGSVIGGYSAPDEKFFGSVYSLDGRTLEEVTGIDFQDWVKQWSEKYD